MGKYTVGVDYGTLSARALLLDIETGHEVAASEFTYPHAILQADFFAPTPLEKTASLEHPQDYLDALHFIVRDVVAKAGITADEVCGIGFDFTSCSTLPVTADGTPLCFLEEFSKEPQAYVKLWNSYSAIFEADRITEIARKENAPWLKPFGDQAFRGFKQSTQGIRCHRSLYRSR